VTGLSFSYTARARSPNLGSEMTDNWSTEETDDPLYADRRNFYKVEKWSRDGQSQSSCSCQVHFAACMKEYYP
jgi:hypothetical protein